MVFISHKDNSDNKRDHVFAHAIKGALVKHTSIEDGDIFVAPESISNGAVYFEKIFGDLAKSIFAIFVVTSAFLQSTWLQSEFWAFYAILKKQNIASPGTRFFLFAESVEVRKEIGIQFKELENFQNAIIDDESGKNLVKSLYAADIKTGSEAAKKGLEDDIQSAADTFIEDSPKLAVLLNSVDETRAKGLSQIRNEKEWRIFPQQYSIHTLLLILKYLMEQDTIEQPFFYHTILNAINTKDDELKLAERLPTLIKKMQKQPEIRGESLISDLCDVIQYLSGIKTPISLKKFISDSIDSLYAKQD